MSNRAMWTYEWDVETADLAGDVQDHSFWDRLNDMPGYVFDLDSDEEQKVLVLVCEDQMPYGDKGWAYVREDGTLPESFLDAYDRPIRKVPQRFHRELAKWQASRKGGAR